MACEKALTLTQEAGACPIVLEESLGAEEWFCFCPDNIWFLALLIVFGLFRYLHARYWSVWFWLLLA